MSSYVMRNTLTSGGTADLDLSWEHDFPLDKAKGDEGKDVKCRRVGFRCPESNKLHKLCRKHSFAGSF